jgi:hypothetical protein
VTVKEVSAEEGAVHQSKKQGRKVSEALPPAPLHSTQQQSAMVLPAAAAAAVGVWLLRRDGSLLLFF